MTSLQTYQVIEQPKDNNYDFIFETDEIMNNTGAIKLQRNAKANRNIVCLTKVPFPPNLTEEDLIRPRNDKCDKHKVPNKFFIYRKWYTMCLNSDEKKNDQTSISPYISEQWRNEPQEIKDYYAVLSKSAGKLFKERYGTDGFKRKSPKSLFVQAPGFSSSSPESQTSHSPEQPYTYDYLDPTNNNMWGKLDIMFINSLNKKIPATSLETMAFPVFNGKASRIFRTTPTDSL
ncbi:2085_t:CDS:2 [Diversispora eburnea]|uniref:2085_t:CDS:1 n=1 Tax=Diversispora eburnea TaxID=1213867 RepID=A0A9N8W0A5_9GLOM|nr:2085_t:CDS:2 [Diversispora eburnea]